MQPMCIWCYLTCIAYHWHLSSLLKLRNALQGVKGIKKK